MSPTFPFRFTTDTSLFSRKETEKQRGNSYLIELSKFGLERKGDCKNLMKSFVSKLQKKSSAKHKDVSINTQGLKITNQHSSAGL